MLRIDLVYALDRLRGVGWSDDAINHVDPSDDQDLVFGLDLAVDFGSELSV